MKVSSWKSLSLLAAVLDLHHGSVSICSGFVTSGASTKFSRIALLSAEAYDRSSSCEDGARRSILSGAMGMGALLAVSAPTVAADKSLSEEYRQGTAALADMDDQAPVPREAYKKLPSSLIYADVRPGNGEEVKEGSRVNLQ